jgi:hypothetical protein
MPDCVKAINEPNFTASRATAYRRINQSALGNYYAAIKPFLKNGHKEQRVGFLLRNNIWDTVVFSEEKTFKSCYDGRVRVYRPRNTRFEEQYTQRSDHSGSFFCKCLGLEHKVQAHCVSWKKDLMQTCTLEFSYIIYQGTDILPEIFSSSPDTRVYVARKLHEGASPRVILSDKHECWTARKNFRRYTGCPRTRGSNLQCVFLGDN